MRGVQTAYRYGCRTFHQLGQFGAKLGICMDCVIGMDGYPMKDKWEDFVQSLPPPPPPPGVAEEPPVGADIQDEEIEEVDVSDVSRGNTPKRVYGSGTSGSDNAIQFAKKITFAMPTPSPNASDDDVPN